MCDMTGYDVVFRDRVTIEEHLCRIINCGGGMSLESACDMVAEYHEETAKMWRDRTHPDISGYPDILYYRGDEEE